MTKTTPLHGFEIGPEIPGTGCVPIKLTRLLGHRQQRPAATVQVLTKEALEQVQAGGFPGRTIEQMVMRSCRRMLSWRRLVPAHGRRCHNRRRLHWNRKRRGLGPGRRRNGRLVKR